MDMPSTHPHARHAHHQHDTDRPDADEDVLKDPVYGMAVTADAEHQFEHGGRSYGFCSARCKSQLASDPASDPEQYLAPREPAPAAPASPGAIYICPMHPEIRQDHGDGGYLTPACV